VESADFDLVSGGAGADSGAAVDAVEASAPGFAACVELGTCSLLADSLAAAEVVEPAFDAEVLLDGGVAGGIT
jgi:hypothetical protein